MAEIDELFSCFDEESHDQQTTPTISSMFVLFYIWNKSFKQIKPKKI